MAGEPTTTAIGNLTSDPELRFVETANGKAVINFTVACTPQSFDRDTKEWKDGETVFMRCAYWGKPAENAAEGLVKGDRVVAIGRLKQRAYEKDGVKHTVIEMEVDELAASVKFATVKTTRTSSGGSSSGGRQRGGQTSRSGAGQQGEDPWATPAGGGGYSDEPPF